MKHDPNVLLTELVDTFAGELKRLSEGGDTYTMGEDGELVPRSNLDDQIKIGRFLIQLTSSRVRAAQGWMRLSTSMGREQMLALLTEIQGVRKLGPSS